MYIKRRFNGFNEVCQEYKKLLLQYGIRTNLGLSITQYPNMKNIETIFQSCKQRERATAENFTSPDGSKHMITSIGFEWFNSIHYVDHDICDFIPMKKHLEDQIIKVISEHCRSISEEGFDVPCEYGSVNQTRHHNSNVCMWQSLNDDDMHLILSDSRWDMHVED